jgi:hypothetical protein
MLFRLRSSPPAADTVPKPVKLGCDRGCFRAFTIWLIRLPATGSAASQRNLEHKGCAAMAYELRIGGQGEGRFETSDEAEVRARALLREDADAILEVIDLATGRVYAPAAGAKDRDDLARKIR